jgi:hypothetical protein
MTDKDKSRPLQAILALSSLFVVASVFARFRSISTRTVSVPDARTDPSPLGSRQSADATGDAARDVPEPRPVMAAKPHGWKSVLEILTFVSVLAYAVISYRMWREMQTQTVNSERAWVGLGDPIVIDGIAGSGNQVKIRGHYTIKNFGHGPALKVVGPFGIFEDPVPKLEMERRVTQSFCDSAVKFATGSVPLVGSEQPGAFGRILFPDQYAEATIDFNGSTETLKHLRFIGCVGYLDQFDKPHWTKFCMERAPGDSTPFDKIPTLQYCAMYNETDPAKSVEVPEKPSDSPKK